MTPGNSTRDCCVPFQSSLASTSVRLPGEPLKTQSTVAKRLAAVDASYCVVTVGVKRYHAVGPCDRHAGSDGSDVISDASVRLWNGTLPMTTAFAIASLVAWPTSGLPSRVTLRPVWAPWNGTISNADPKPSLVGTKRTLTEQVA